MNKDKFASPIWVILLILCSSHIAPAHASPQNVEIYTYDVLPNLAYRNEQNELTGLYIEIVKTAVSRMPDYSVSFVVVPWNRAKYEVRRGKAFAILPPYFHAHDWLTEEEPRRPYIWPYSRPLFTQTDIVVCNERVSTVNRKVWPDDYAGLLFVMWSGDGRAGTEFDSMVQKNQIKKVLAPNIESSIGVVQLGRADCTVTALESYRWLLNNGKTRKGAKGVLATREVQIVSVNDGYLGYTDIDAEKNFPFKKDFVIKFDIEIYKMERSGELQSIIGRFLDKK